MKLRHLTNQSLLDDTQFFLNCEKEFFTKIVEHLKEIEKRKLYVGLGYPSLQEYCEVELGYSEDEAERLVWATSQSS